MEPFMSSLSKWKLLALLSFLPLASLIGGILWERNAVILLPAPPTGSAPTISLHAYAHDPWDRLLHRFVDESGSVSYADWKGSAADQQSLDQYLFDAGSVSFDQDATRTDELCFWINIYNALTIKGILLEYPTDSILDHVRSVGYNVWKDLRLYVDGRYVSLDDIEHQILRKMNEPRIHFAIVCASAGCPRLRNEAYIPQRLDEQLSDNARQFFSRGNSLQISEDGTTIYLSSILKWFGRDFGPDDASMLSRIMPFLPDRATGLVTASPPPHIQFLDYDWSLNDRQQKRTPSPSSAR
jgi:hypothetical protein